MPSQTIAQLLTSNLRRTTLHLWGGLVVILLAYGAYTLQVLRAESERLILSQTMSLAESFVTSQDVFMIQRELTRFSEVVDHTQGLRVGIDISLDHIPIAATNAIRSHVTEAFDWSFKSEKDLPSGKHLTVSGTIDYSTKIWSLAVALGFFSLLLFGLISLVASLMRRAVSEVTGPLERQITQIKHMAQSVPEVSGLKKISEPTGIFEVDDLDASVGVLAEAVVNYHRASLANQKARVEAERQAATNDAVSKMTQMLAHDMRRPLTMTRWFIDEMSHLHDAGKIRNLALAFKASNEDALRQAEGMSADVIELGTNGSLEIESLSVADLVNASLHEACRFAVTPGVTISVDLCGGYRVRGHSLKLRRVVVNLVENALHAMEYSGRLSIDTQVVTIDRKSLMIFRIKNSGPIIPEEGRDRIFDAFVTSGKKHGSGLGLAVARKVVDTHGGWISCESEPDVGTTFSFAIPSEHAALEEGVQWSQDITAFSLEICVKNELSDDNAVRESFQ